MAKTTNGSESEGRYEILQNAVGEILIIIKHRAGGPENPRFVYDGGDQALLYRSRESSVMLGNINEKARQPLKSVDEIIMVEVDKDEVAREYIVPMRLVRNLQTLLDS